MATYDLDHLDTFLHFNTTGALDAKYTDRGSATIAIEGLPNTPFSNENICQLGITQSRAFSRLAEYAIVGAKRTVSLNSALIINISNQPSGNGLCSLSLSTLNNGTVQLRTGGLYNGFGSTVIASSPPGLAIGNISGQNPNYAMWEMACRFVSAPNASIETRLNGVRVPSLTTDNFAASADGTDGVGLISQASVTLNAAAISPLPSMMNFVGSGKCGWNYIALGTALWKSRRTDTTTRAGQADFIGDGKRWCSRVDLASAPYSYPTNWVDGILNSPATTIVTFPAELAETNFDGDVGHIRNVTVPTGVDADRASWGYLPLPSTATKVLALQRTLFARGNGTTALTKMKTGMLNGGAPVEDAGAGPVIIDGGVLADGTYLCFRRPQNQPPAGGTAIWTPGIANAQKAYVQLFSMS